METKLCPQFIRFTPDDSLTCKEWFMQQYKIPGVIGCVDGTHIGLQKPTVNEHMYFNRKGYHSINAKILACPWHGTKKVIAETTVYLESQDA
ncbi:putative nuclease HARBI1 isoform X2 [Bactrocera neohumeralis]|uniref:putative nuclease HARBI1 isoform X2 n=1 Tax=Bactrocera neohumeralis TaxID=98809 RepID=UPI002166269D|nr:putative nuclease HARBI1 isoform X2 [Bactrocera neohumeralis]